LLLAAAAAVPLCPAGGRSAEGVSAHTMRTESQAQQPQLLDVSTALLDSMVVEYLMAEDFVEEVRGRRLLLPAVGRWVQ
jgi:uncharacterized protein YjaZ